MTLKIENKYWKDFKIGTEPRDDPHFLSVLCSLAGEDRPTGVTSLSVGNDNDLAHSYEWFVGISCLTLETLAPGQKQPHWFDWIDNSSDELLVVQALFRHDPSRMFIQDESPRVFLYPGKGGIHFQDVLSGVLRGAVAAGGEVPGVKVATAAAKPMVDQFTEHLDHTPLWTTRRYLHTPGGFPGLEWIIKKRAFQEHGALHRGHFSLRFFGSGGHTDEKLEIELRVGLQTNEQKGLFRYWCNDPIVLTVTPRWNPA